MTRYLTRPPLWLADLMLLAVAIVWGSSYGITKEALAFYPVLGFLAVRFGLTFLLLLPSLYPLSRTVRRAAWRAGVPLGALLLGIFLCETYGVSHTRAANAAFLISLCVVFTPFAQWLLLRQRPDRTAWLATGVSLLGAALLTDGASMHWGWGDALMLGAAMLRAILVCLTKKWQHNVPALPLTAVQAATVATGCLIIGTLMLPNGLPALPQVNAFWLASVYLVLLCTVFAFFAQNYALRRQSPTRVALLMGSEPVFGALFAVVWLGEQLTPVAWLGGLLIVAASLWAILPARTPKLQLAG
ncbi:hypothetical protein IGB42_03865 [Andreprevotia sp. IGB-42]|uniref:DMT family transporter n=1 Tax=Andreprevotia sp. IGB-42 TaxID=2497473 RepID=UPI001357094D|nr:EamA family transporter [Andreprevotia sp. IGB-42]KAF0811706.1 hypothetical protein IGB42_03865 [Andreprevotia sp. IGB-42]